MNDAENATDTPKRGFAVDRCPMCGAETTISVDLDDLVFTCGEDCQWTADDVRRFVGQWVKVLAWVDTAPIREE